MNNEKNETANFAFSLIWVYYQGEVDLTVVLLVAQPRRLVVGDEHAATWPHGRGARSLALARKPS